MHAMNCAVFESEYSKWPICDIPWYAVWGSLLFFPRFSFELHRRRSEREWQRPGLSLSLFLPSPRALMRTSSVPRQVLHSVGAARGGGLNCSELPLLAEHDVNALKCASRLNLLVP